jgi:ABC-type dipeptide/oligopeptide/nickel transport system permease subunit
MGSPILTEADLSYLEIGTVEPTASWRLRLSASFCRMPKKHYGWRYFLA